MMYKDLFFTIHWVPVIVVSLISLVITYGWSCFAAASSTVPGSETDGLPGRATFGPLSALSTFLLQLLAFANLSLVVAEQGWIQGIVTGFAISIVWVLPALVTANFNGVRSWRVLLRDGGLYVLLYTIGGLTLGIW